MPVSYKDGVNGSGEEDSVSPGVIDTTEMILDWLLSNGCPIIDGIYNMAI